MIQFAEYIADYKIKVTFIDGAIRKIDLKPFLLKSIHPLVRKYLDVDLFKKFKIEQSALCWGENEFDINPMSIYNGDFDIKTRKHKVKKHKKKLTDDLITQ